MNKNILALNFPLGRFRVHLPEYDFQVFYYPSTKALTKSEMMELRCQ